MVVVEMVRDHCHYQHQSPKKTRSGGKHSSSSAPSLLARGDQGFNVNSNDIKNRKEKETNKNRKKEEKEKMKMDKMEGRRRRRSWR